MKSIYEQLLEKNIPVSNHESDLYAKCTSESKIIIDAYEHRSNVTTFKNNLDGKFWYDIPFAYDPFWNKKENQNIESRK